jgi:hypothetical protein
MSVVVGSAVPKLLWIVLLLSASACKRDDKPAPRPERGSASASVAGAAQLATGGAPAAPLTNAVPGSERQLAAFDGVELDGSIDVELAVGDAQHVEVVADPDLVPLVTTEVKAHMLIVSTKPEFRGSNVVVRVSVPSLVLARLAGSGNLQLDGVRADDLALELTGSGNLAVRGTAHHVTFVVAGSGSLHAKALTSENAEVHATGSGDVDVAATKSLAAQLAGSGSIRYYGNPPNVAKQITGSGSIEAG